MRFGAALRTATRTLAASSESARFDAQVLLEAASGRSSAWLVAHGDEQLDEPARERFERFVARRASGEPVAYITGTAGFYGRLFGVDARVLIPRPESEHLVEAALAHLRTRRARGASLLRAADVGTGSGALAITLAAELEGLDVVASDLSREALEVARANAERLGVASRVRFVAGDLLEPLRGYAPYDCVVANLPYVPSAELPVAPNPVAFEPVGALDGGRDGLALYRRLLRGLDGVCAPGAALFFEAAPATIDALARLAEEHLPRAFVEIVSDYAALERVVAVTLPEPDIRREGSEGPIG